jgi:hypothetical protein
MSGTVVLAGHRRAPAALLLVARLASWKDSPAPLRAVLCVSELTPGRLWQWYHRYRSGLWAKVRSSLGLSAGGDLDHERRAFDERLAAEGVRHRRLDRLCRDLGVPFHLVTGLNDAGCLRLVERYRPDAAVYTGGGILREPLIGSFPRGILNLHCGPLPHVRGMNGVEWALFFGFRPTVTLHYIDAGIDTGAVVAEQALEVARGEPLGRLRARAVLAGLDLLAEHYDALPSGQGPRRPNPPHQGRQYYAMSEPLKELVQGWVDQGITPCVSAAEVDPEDLRPAPARLVPAGGAR